MIDFHPLRRCALLGALLISSLVSAAAKQNPNYDFRITTDKGDQPFYHKGEKVTFTISLAHQGQPMDGAKVKWVITKDGVLPPLQSGTVALKNGTFVVSGSMDEPGFLQCRADFQSPGEVIPTARAGAAIDISEIKPSMPAPDDFDAYWTAQKKLLKDTPANVRITPVKSTDPAVECFDIQADCPNGAPFSAYLARPVGAKPGTLPAIVCTQGAGVASSRLGIVEGWAKEGLLALDFNAHGLPNGKDQAFYSDLYKGPLKQYYMKDPGSRDTLFFHVLFFRVMRALDVVTSQPEWDGKRLIVSGRSQGGGQAIAAAGLDPRVTLVCAQIPTFCDHTGMTIGRIAGWPKIVPNGADGKPDPQALQAARYYDSMNWAVRTKAQALFTVGFIDVSCPPTGIYAVYNLWGGKKDIVNFPYYGHIASPEGDAAVLKAVRDYIHEPPVAK